MFIAEKIGIAALGGIDIGEITEIKTTLKQLFPLDLVFAGGIHSREDTPVFAQGIVDIPHKIIDVAVLLVMPGRPALITTKSLVIAAMYIFAALFA